MSQRSGPGSRPTSNRCQPCWRARNVIIYKVSLRPWKGEGIPRLVSRYKNNGFVNSWYFQVWRMFIKPKEFQWFWCFRSMSNFKMSITPKEIQWFWCVRSMSNFKMSIKPKELQWFWSANQPMSQWVNQPICQPAKSGSGSLGPKSAPRGTKSTTFA